MTEDKGMHWHGMLDITNQLSRRTRSLHNRKSLVIASTCEDRLYIIAYTHDLVATNETCLPGSTQWESSTDAAILSRPYPKICLESTCMLKIRSCFLKVRTFARYCFLLGTAVLDLHWKKIQYWYLYAQDFWGMTPYPFTFSQ